MKFIVKHLLFPAGEKVYYPPDAQSKKVNREMCNNTVETASKETKQSNYHSVQMVYGIEEGYPYNRSSPQPQGDRCVTGPKTQCEEVNKEMYNNAVETESKEVKQSNHRSVQMVYGIEEEHRYNINSPKPQNDRSAAGIKTQDVENSVSGTESKEVEDKATSQGDWSKKESDYHSAQMVYGIKERHPSNRSCAKPQNDRCAAGIKTQDVEHSVSGTENKEVEDKATSQVVWSKKESSYHSARMVYGIEERQPSNRSSPQPQSDRSLTGRETQSEKVNKEMNKKVSQSIEEGHSYNRLSPQLQSDRSDAGIETLNVEHFVSCTEDTEVEVKTASKDVRPKKQSKDHRSHSLWHPKSKK